MKTFEAPSLELKAAKHGLTAISILFYGILRGEPQEIILLKLLCQSLWAVGASGISAINMNFMLPMNFIVLTWTCCAFLLMLMMFTIIVLMVYGISVGYHYAQKELASFAMTSRSTTEPSILRRSGGGNADGRPVVRLVAVNRSEVESAPEPLLEVYQTKRPGERVYLETSETPVVLLETQRPPREPELSPHERELTRRLIGRFRRSRNTTTSTSIPFLRPLNSTEPPIPAAA